MERCSNSARSYQKGNYDAASGRVEASAGAGVELYAFNGAFRGNAADARYADDLVKSAESRGAVAEDAPVSEETLRQAGAAGPEEAQKLAAAYDQNQGQIRRLGDDQLLEGFGSNGGEEFLSYLMTSETLVIAGGDKFHEWQDKMQGRLAKIQNSDGSWSGHHCITSPVFCTAAVVQCIAADQDVEFLVKMAHRTTGGAEEQIAAAPTPRMRRRIDCRLCAGFITQPSIAPGVNWGFVTLCHDVIHRSKPSCARVNGACHAVSCCWERQPRR